MVWFSAFPFGKVDIFLLFVRIREVLGRFRWLGNLVIIFDNDTWRTISMGSIGSVVTFKHRRTPLDFITNLTGWCMLLKIYYFCQQKFRLTLPCVILVGMCGSCLFGLGFSFCLSNFSLSPKHFPLQFFFLRLQFLPCSETLIAALSDGFLFSEVSKPGISIHVVLYFRQPMQCFIPVIRMHRSKPSCHAC